MVNTRLRYLRIFLLSSAGFSIFIFTLYFAFYGIGQTFQSRPIAVIASSPSPDSNQPVLLRLALIGDTGAPESQEPVLNNLLAWSQSSHVPALVIFLGDTIYDEGLPPRTDPGRLEAEKRLIPQLDIIKQSKAQAIFIPGNHDWGKSRTDGLNRLIEMKTFIQDNLVAYGHVMPTPGCPGPEYFDINPIRIVFLDTQWWLEKEENKDNTDCKFMDPTAFDSELTRLLSQAKDRHVLVMGHHPLASHGPHGGYSSNPLISLKKWVFPSNQDLGGSRYAKLADKIKHLFFMNPPLLYASGHDHSLQILDGGPFADLFLVSGGGSSQKITPVGWDKDTIFAESQAGFISLEFLENGQVYVLVRMPGLAYPRFSLLLSGKFPHKPKYLHHIDTELSTS